MWGGKNYLASGEGGGGGCRDVLREGIAMSLKSAKFPPCENCKGCAPEAP